MGDQPLVLVAELISSGSRYFELRRDKLAQKSGVFVINFIYVVLAKITLHIKKAGLLLLF